MKVAGVDITMDDAKVVGRDRQWRLCASQYAAVHVVPPLDACCRVCVAAAKRT